MGIFRKIKEKINRVLDGQRLLMAIIKNDMSYAEELIESGAEVNVRSILGATPLLAACISRNEAIVNRLIGAGAKVNARSIFGVTPLMNTCMLGDETIVNRLIESGAKVNARSILGGTPLMDACLSGNEAIVNRLVGAGAKVNARSIFGVTPLMNACISRNEVIVNQLIEAGADVNVKDRKGRTALLFAYERRMVDVEEKLITKGATVDSLYISLEEAYMRGDEPMTMALIEQGADFSELLEKVEVVEIYELFNKAVKKYLAVNINKLSVSTNSAYGTTIKSNDKHFMKACVELTKLRTVVESSRQELGRELKEYEDDISQQTINLLYASKHMRRVGDLQAADSSKSIWRRSKNNKYMKLL